MNEQDQFDRADAEIEALLRATFASEARGKVSDTRAVPPFPAAASTTLATVHPIRRRWVGFSLVAAVLVAVVAGATVIGTQAMQSRQAPVPAGTSNAPDPTVSAPRTPTTRPTTSAPPSTPPASSPPPASTRQLTSEGVTLTVPTTWSEQPLTPDAMDFGATRTCLATGASDEAVTYDPTRCVLAFRVGDVGASPFDARGYDVPVTELCSAAGQVPAGLQPLADDQVTIAGQVVEHRTWSTTCLPSSSIETWTVPTWPLVQFVRIGPAADTATIAAVRTAVESAVLPAPPSALRAIDFGYPTAVNGDVVSIDRITVLGTSVQNSNPTTYDYPIAPGTTIYVAGVDGAPSTITMDQFRAELAGEDVAGVLPIDELYILVETDGNAATYVALRPRSQLS